MEDAPKFDAPGGNNPPGPIEFAKQAFADLSAWLDANPAVTTDDAARTGKLMLDRTKATLGDLDSARDKEAKPHYDKWKLALAKFKTPYERLDRLRLDLQRRLTAFALAEETKRKEEAAQAAAELAAAEQAARVALAREKEATDNAAQGEYDAKVGAAVEATDDAISTLRAAEATAQRAERATHVRVTGGFNRAAGLRTVETLIVEDWQAAMADLAGSKVGIDTNIKAAIITASRVYRTAHGRLPKGIKREEERKL